MPEKTVIAKLKKGGKTFEILVHPEQAHDYKQGKNVSIHDVVATDAIFEDAKKGTRASHTEMERIFGTADPIEIAQQILKTGNVPVTEDMLRKAHDQKKRQIVDFIHRHTVDPTTGKPHPPHRIDNAMNDAKVKVNEHKSAEAQVQDIIHQLRTILPLKYETRELYVKIPVQYAQRSAAILRQHGKILEEKWNTDGSLSAKIELPAGLQEEFETAINSIAHGNAEIKIVATH